MIVIYGSKQKQFDCHSCSICKNWFHLFCLSHCNVTLSKRSQDHVCPYARFLGNTSNTCTSDNFVTILSLPCLQYNRFSGKIGFSKAESILRQLSQRSVRELCSLAKPCFLTSFKMLLEIKAHELLGRIVF